MKVIKKIILYSITAGVIIGGFFAYAPIRAATVKFFYPLQKDVGNGLVGYWTFDAADGALDKSGNGNNGTFTGTTQTSGQVNGARSFGGSSYMDIASTSGLPTGSSARTFSAWVYPTSDVTADIIDSGQTTNSNRFGLARLNTKKIYFAGQLDDVSGTLDIPTNQWSHVAVSFTGSFISLYVNGVLDPASAAKTTLNTISTHVRIGNVTSGSEYFAGSIDDVRIYNRALSAAEIKAYYDATSQGKFVNKPSIPLSTPNNNGLVGYWNFDANDSGATITDMSGNGNTGTANGTTVVGGKIGNARSFNGTSDYVTLPIAPFAKNFNNLSFSLWFKTSATVASGGEADLLVVGNRSLGYYAIAVDGDNGFYINYGNVTTPFLSQATLNNGVWHHLVGVWSGNATITMYLDGVSAGSGTGVPLGIGNNESAIGANKASSRFYFNGQEDDVRIYNRALTANEVVNLYNSTRQIHANVSPTNQLTSGLVGYWTFDGNDTPWTSATAATTLDRSGNANTGTLTNMNQSTAVIPGVHGQALSFNGTSNYIAVTDSSSISPASALTLSAWVNTSNTDSSKYQMIFAKHKNTPYYGYNFHINTDNTVIFQLRPGGVCCSTLTTATTVSTNTWYYLVATYDNATMKIYINGVFNTSISASGTINGAQDLNIGRDVFSPTAGFFNGKIDDVRIYNRALSPDEVQMLYKSGQRL